MKLLDREEVRHMRLPPLLFPLLNDSGYAVLSID